MTHKSLFLGIVLGLVWGASAEGDVIHVPADHVTIQAAINAAADGDEIILPAGTFHQSIDFAGKAVKLSCSAGPDKTIIRGNGSGPTVSITRGEGPDTVLQGCIFEGGSAQNGGAMYIWYSSPIIIGCTFIDNVAGEMGGAVAIFDFSEPTFIDCEFTGNRAIFGGAIGIRNELDHIAAVVTDCRFTNNFAIVGGAIVAVGHSSSENYRWNLSLANCEFKRNKADVVGGAILGGWGTATLTNCVFDRNSSDFVVGGASLGNTLTNLSNCVFYRNTADDEGGALQVEGGDVTVSNSVLWANSPTPIFVAGQKTLLAVHHTDVQGGWGGEGNIDADPLFVQQGTGNLRLSFESPCINAGNNDALPADEFDLDGDGDTDEPLPVDLDGAERIQDGVVDMGPYEGGHEALPPGDLAEDLDRGEGAFLLPCGDQFDFIRFPAVVVTNVTGPDNATYAVTCIDWALHPFAGSFSELATILLTDTSIPDGQFLSRMFIPFDAGQLQGADPLMVNLTHLDPATGDWRLAVAANTQNSPKHGGPRGDRFAEQGSASEFGASTELGDYGVFWDPAQQRGVAWANVDHGGDFALGTSLCAADCAPGGGDGVIDRLDLQALLDEWGTLGGNGPCDFNDDGRINVADLLAVLGTWGACRAGSNSLTGPPPARQKLRHDGEKSTNGRRIDMQALVRLLGAWGSCASRVDCPADLDHSGRVDGADLRILLGDTRNRG